MSHSEWRVQAVSALLAVGLMVGGVASAFASAGGWCEGRLIPGAPDTLVCTPHLCDEPPECERGAGMMVIWIFIPPDIWIPIPVGYQFCNCIEGQEDTCCHLVYVIDPEPATGAWPKGTCENTPAQICYDGGICKIGTTLGGIKFSVCMPE